MFYSKNVPVWERAVRVILGVACLGFAAMNWNTSTIIMLAGASGAMLALTGLFGFCPGCALVGRKLDKGN